MFKRRLIILFAALLVVSGVLLARLAQVQLAWHDRFRRERYTRAGGNRTVETVRGGIYTRWGTPLVREIVSFDLGVHYDDLPKPDWKLRVARLTGRPLHELEERTDQIIDRVERIRRAVQRNTGMEHVRVVEQNRAHRLVSDVDPGVAAAVRAAPDRFPGIVVLETSRREYSNGKLAPHIVGQVGIMTPEKWREVCARNGEWTMRSPVSEIGDRYKKDDRFGVSGVEKAFEDLLRGRRGYVINRLAFHILKVEEESVEVPPEPGCDVYLTIREDFQRAANEALRWAAGQEALEFTRGALVITDVRTGAVLAAATYPGYDASAYRETVAGLAKEPDPRSPLLFRPTRAALPTGSVYKIITAIAALEQGAITPATTFVCEGVETFRGRPFHCTARWGHKRIALLPAIEHSCNIYFYHTGLAAGGEALARWGRAFGLGMPTGLDLPERTGQVPEANATFEILNLSIGQGRLLCTPLQVANAMAAVANGGRLYTPHFFDHARSKTGETLESYKPDARQIDVRPGTLQTVQQGMRLVVSGSGGTARNAGLEPFRAAGKTGTAELGQSGLNHAWFAGYAPHGDPKVAFAVVSERTPGHGGSHAAPIVAHALEPIWPQVMELP